MEILMWVETNWFSLAQTLGILAGFMVASRSLSLESRARQAEIFLELNQSHREIWENLVSTPELGAVLDPTRRVSEHPSGPSEERLVLLVVLHTSSVHRAIQLGVFPSWTVCERTLGNFRSSSPPRSLSEVSKISGAHISPVLDTLITDAERKPPLRVSPKSQK